MGGRITDNCFFLSVLFFYFGKVFIKNMLLSSSAESYS